MYKHTAAFVAFCKSELSFELSIQYGYQSLSACILDCVYSLRAKYYSVTIPVVERYAAKYLNNDRFASGETVSQLIQHIDNAGGPMSFAEKVLRNKQKSGGILKAEICYQLAKYLGYLHIETIDDFRRFESAELLEIVIRSVKGIGDAGTNYLFMLAGDPDRCKPDVHIHHCIRDACGEDIRNEECQVLFSEAVAELRDGYPELTVATLDGIIWNKYQSSRKR
ncbi:MAG: hypothetical protein IKP17_00670 [Oscillospiraceae bacterium]|nr:hypothetical protein [Oscillospiraceae bacterium]